MTDPIADYLTRIRNAYMAGKKVVEIPSSKMKESITKILFEKGYILTYKIEEGTPFNTIKIALKYHPDKDRRDQEDRPRVQAWSQEIYGCGEYAACTQRSRHRYPFHFKGHSHRQGGQGASRRW